MCVLDLCFILYNISVKLVVNKRLFLSSKVSPGSSQCNYRKTICINGVLQIQEPSMPSPDHRPIKKLIPILPKVSQDIFNTLPDIIVNLNPKIITSIYSATSK